MSRRFGEVEALRDVSFAVRDGEFFSMLGPSGSGKTTSLRLIAGFDQPTSGDIRLHGVTTKGRPPYERDVNTVFQDYALFPHMSVMENVTYGPRVRGMFRSDAVRRAKEMLEAVRLGPYADRKPSELSGGQRQRVALARALINEPRVLLLDEPLGALDLKLREEMQVELKALQKRVGITFVYVTHDQGEALAMSDRIAVFNAGRIEQIAAPRDLYENPATPFVASFVGLTNLFTAETARHLGLCDRAFAVRPERLRLVDPGTALPTVLCAVDARVEEVLYLGAITRYVARLRDGVRLIVQQQVDDDRSAPTAKPGDNVRIAWRRAHNRVFDSAA